MLRATIIALTLLLAACGNGEDSKVTETRMDDIDNMQGTISDEMVDADELNEQPMIEATPAPGAKPKGKASEDKAQDKAAPAPELKADPAVAEGE